MSTWFGKSESYEKYYLALGNVLFQFIIPTIILAFCNIFTLMKVKQIRKNASSATLHKREQRMAVMMIFQVSMFMICNSVHKVHLILWSLDVYDKEKDNSADIVWHTSHVLMTLDCSILLVSMSVFSKKYRKMILSLSCSQKKRTDGILVDKSFIISGTPNISQNRPKKVQNNKKSKSNTLAIPGSSAQNHSIHNHSKSN